MRLGLSIIAMNSYHCLRVGLIALAWAHLLVRVLAPEVAKVMVAAQLLT